MPKEEYAGSLQRLFELLRLIPKPPVQRTISELQRELSEVRGEPVDKRWMERSLQMLRDQFPIHVNDKSRPYGWRWEKHASFDIPGMTLSEAQTLALAEQHLKPLLRRTIRDALQGLFGQARKMLGQPQHHPRGRRSWLDKIRSVPAWQPLLEPSVDPAIRDTVYQALHSDRPFRAGYQKPWQDEPIEYTVHPLGLVQRGQILYLVCVMEDFDDLRLLCLHRIRSAELLDEPLRTPPGFDLDKAIAGGLFGMGGSLSSWSPASTNRWPCICWTWLAVDQTIKDIDDYHLELTATVLHTAQLEWWLRSFASEVEVLEPPELREAMAEQAEWLMRKYRFE